MCKLLRNGRMPIVFDDDSQMFNNTAFIDELASLLRVMKLMRMMKSSL